MYTFATARVIFLSLPLRQLNFKSKVSIEAPKPVAADLSSMPKACVGSFERIQMKQHMYIHTCIRLYVYMCMCICVCVYVYKYVYTRMYIVSCRYRCRYTEAPGAQRVTGP